MRILGKQIIGDREYRKSLSDARSRGFGDCVNSLIKIIESGEEIVLGNNTAFVGLKTSAPTTIIGNHTTISHSTLALSKKHGPDAYCIKIGQSLE